MYICAEVDQSFGEEVQKKTQAILSTKKDIKSEFIHYPGVEHGFAVRGDESIPHIKEQKEKALHDAIEFFKAQL